MNNSFEWRAAPKAQYGVVGDPVAHSLSPAMHNAAFLALGMVERYEAVRVPEQEFAEALAHLASLGYRGLNVTVPLKKAAYKWSEAMPKAERRMGVVNTLRLDTKEAINTDAPGFLDTLAEIGRSEPCDVLLLGAGATTRSLAVALDEAGFRLHCWNRTRANLERLMHELGIEPKVHDEPDPKDCPLILNTTSASMQGEHLPVKWHNAMRTAVAYDVYYTNGLTTFLTDAFAHGLETVDGRRLLVAQGARSFEWWTGKSPPLQAMMKAVT
jgi:shikimate dehydrogenase